MTTKFSLFGSAATPTLADELVGLQGGANVIYTMAQLAALFGSAKYAANIGDGLNVQYTVNHALSTRDVLVEVYRNATPWDTIIADIARPDANNITVTFSTAPAANQFRVLVRA